MRSKEQLLSSPELRGIRTLCIDDIDGLIALTEACREADQIETVPTADQMRRQFETPGIEITNNVFVLPNSAGEIIATVSAVPLPGVDEYHIQLNGTVRPDHRSGEPDLEDTMIELGLANATEWMARTGNKAAIQGGCWSYQQNQIDLLIRNGFRPIRYFHSLERDLKLPIDPSPVPDEILFRPINFETDAEALHLALHDSFKDHFNPINFTMEQTNHWASSPDFRPDLILLAYKMENGEEVEPAAICMNHIKNNYNIQHNKLEGEVGALGVRRPYRRKGIARALLTKSLSLLRDAGMETATLSVDSENPLGATDLYASVGFTQRKTAIVYQWDPALAGLRST